MCKGSPSLSRYPGEKNPLNPSSPPAASEAMEMMRRLRRMKPLEQPSVFGLFFLSVLCFLCCFFYLNYRMVLVNGGGLGFRQQQENQDGHLDFELGEGGGGDGTCDLFDGRWVWDDSYPLYEARDCGFLDEGFRCSENGRPDNFYTKWRWQPRHCNLSRFDGKEMLERLRNQRMVFVGDSIGRNQWESLLCMLSSALPDKSSIYEVNGSPITKHNGFLVFKFKDFNCTVEYYRAPFLVVQSRAPAGAPEGVITTIKLDIMDWTSVKWRDADVLVFNTGHWWNYEKTIRGGCYFQEGKEVKMNMSVESAYRRSIKTLFNWIRREVNMSRTQVIYRTYAPVHFRGGNWKTGGSCHLETLPELESLQLPSKPQRVLFSTVMDALSEFSIKDKALELDVLNVTDMTVQRKDGHSSLYYLGPMGPAPLHRQDCSHWCLPGVPDTWNELLYALFLRRHSETHQQSSNQVKFG